MENILKIFFAWFYQICFMTYLSQISKISFFFKKVYLFFLIVVIPCFMNKISLNIWFWKIKIQSSIFSWIPLDELIIIFKLVPEQSMCSVPVQNNLYVKRASTISWLGRDKIPGLIKPVIEEVNWLKSNLFTRFQPRGPFYIH